MPPAQLPVGTDSSILSARQPSIGTESRLAMQPSIDVGMYWQDTDFDISKPGTGEGIDGIWPTRYVDWYMKSVTAPPGTVFPDLRARIPLSTDSLTSSNVSKNPKKTTVATTTLPTKAKGKRPATNSNAREKGKANATTHHPSAVARGRKLQNVKSARAAASTTHSLNTRSSFSTASTAAPEFNTPLSSSRRALGTRSASTATATLPNMTDDSNHSPNSGPEITSGHGVKFTREQVCWLAEYVISHSKPGKKQHTSWMACARAYRTAFNQNRTALSLSNKYYNEILLHSGGAAGYLAAHSAETLVEEPAKKTAPVDKS